MPTPAAVRLPSRGSRLLVGAAAIVGVLCLGAATDATAFDGGQGSGGRSSTRMGPPPPASPPVKPSVPPPPPATPVQWQRWEHPRFHFAIDVPADLNRAPAPAGVDGLTLTSRDGRMEVRVFGQLNPERVDLANALVQIKAGIKGAKFDYERVFANNFVLSGIQGNDGFYVRFYISDDRSVFTILIIGHPREPSRAVSDMVTRLSKSLVPSQGDGQASANVATKVDPPKPTPPKPPPPPPPPPQPPPQPQPPPVAPPPPTPPANGQSELERLKLQAEIERLKLEQMRLSQAPPSTPQAAKPAEAPTPSAVASSAARGRRVALVIGNGAYASAPKLPTSAKDAARMSEMLRTLGFDVTVGTDRIRSQMAADLGIFYERAKGADVALFYFSGHGVQVNGHNYLLPVDAGFDDPQAALDVDGRAVDLQKYLNAAAGARTVLAFVDACRDNPIVEENLARTFYKGVGGPTKGLAVVRKEDIGSGQFVGFAADEGKTAQTGDGEVSVYTAALLKLLPTPGEDISVLHRKVRRQVEETTGGRQSPRSVDDLREALFLAPTR